MNGREWKRNIGKKISEQRFPLWLVPIFILGIVITGIVFAKSRLFCSGVQPSQETEGKIEIENVHSAVKKSLIGKLPQAQENLRNIKNQGEEIETSSAKKPESKIQKLKSTKNTSSSKDSKKSDSKDKKEKKKVKIVKDSYFNDAVFIGDSRTEGFGLYSGLTNATFYTDKGLMVDSVFKNKPVKINGKKITIIDALKKKTFGKVYVMFGVNELGWVYPKQFIEKYVKLLDEIKKSQPNAIIYVQSILHVSKKKSNSSEIYNNKKINARNKLIKKMAKEESVHYLDVNQAVTDKSGNLYEDASSDGVHLNKKYCNLWKEYLKKHTV